MRFEIDAAEFSRLAKRAAQFASHGSDINPGLSLVLIDVSESGLLRMRAHTSDSGVVVTHRLVKDSGFEPGVAAMEVAHLEKIVGVVPPRTSVVVAVGDGPKASIRAGSLALNVPRADSDNFFPLPKPGGGDWFDVPAAKVVDVARRTSWSMCSDGSRPQLAGVHLCPSWSESTDGSLFARVSPGIVPPGVDVVVRGETLSRLRTMVETERELSTLVDGNRIWFRGDGWATFSLLITDRFPNTSPVFFARDEQARAHVIGDSSFPLHHVYVSRGEMLEAVRRITGVSIANEERKIGAGVVMDVTEGQLHLRSDYPFNDLSQSIIVDEVIAWSEGSVTAADVSGFQSLSRVALYAKYVSMALDALSCDVVRVVWADPFNGQSLPVQFQDDESEMSALVSPRRRGHS